MNVAEWIIVAILSMTLLLFLILGIVLIIRLLDLSKEVKKVVIEGQDIAKNTAQSLVAFPSEKTCLLSGKE